MNKRKNAKQISKLNFSTLYLKIPRNKLLNILYKIVDSVFKGCTRDYIAINMQSCASCSSKKLKYQWDLNQHDFLLSSFQPTKKLTGLSQNVSLAQSIFEKSINDGGTFEKHRDIYPAELELKKKNNGNSLSSFLDLYIYIGNGEFNTRLFEYYHFTTLYVPRKLFLWEQSFLEFLEQQVKLKIFLIIVNSC